MTEGGTGLQYSYCTSSPRCLVLREGQIMCIIHGFACSRCALLAWSPIHPFLHPWGALYHALLALPVAQWSLRLQATCASLPVALVLHASALSCCTEVHVADERQHELAMTPYFFILTTAIAGLLMTALRPALHASSHEHHEHPH